MICNVTLHENYKNQNQTYLVQTILVWVFASAIEYTGCVELTVKLNSDSTRKVVKNNSFSFIKYMISIIFKTFWKIPYYRIQQFWLFDIQPILYIYTPESWRPYHTQLLEDIPYLSFFQRNQFS